jgi:type IV secretion system protein VirD4
MVAKMMTANSSKVNPYLHGSARWANQHDIEKAGLLPRPITVWQKLKGKDQLPNTGVYVGAWKDKKGVTRYLRHNGAEHVLCYAPTRSGKGVGLVIPTLLSWEQSVVVTDLKGELWELTSGWRQKHARNKVLRFEPASLNGSVRWNALDEIRLATEYEVGDVQNLSTLLVDPDGKGLETHWQKTAQALLVGVILHVLYKAKIEGTEATLPAVDAILSDPNRDIAELWMEMITYGHVNGKNHPAVGSGRP